MVTLDDVETGMFMVFVESVYTQKITPWNFNQANYAHGTLWAVSYECASLARWYVFADWFLVSGMKNVVMDPAYAYYLLDAPFYETVAYVFVNLPHQDPYLQLLVDTQCKNREDEDGLFLEPSDIDGLPLTFLYRIMQRYRGLRKEKIPSAIRERTEYDMWKKEDKEKMGRKKRRVNTD